MLFRSFSYWEQRDPLVRFRNYLTEKDLWTTEHEDELIEQYTEEIQEEAKEADRTAKMSVSESLKWMYDEPGQNIQEQIEKYEAKESK